MVHQVKNLIPNYKTEVENILLKPYYESWENEVSSPFDILLKEVPGADRRIFQRAMERMEKEFLLKNLASGYYGRYNRTWN